MDTIVISGKIRDKVGSQESSQARRNGWVPANLYGHGEPNLHCLLPEKQVRKFIDEEHHLITVDLGNKKESGLLKEIQFDALGERILHVDFARVSLQEVVEAPSSIHVAGSAKGVAAGGVLDVLHHEVMLKGSALSLPESIEIDVSELGIGDAIRVSELKLPARVECLLEPDEPIAIVHSAEIETSEESEPERTEPTVIGKEDKEED